MKKNLVFLVAFLAGLACFSSAYVIENDTVCYENQRGKLCQTPHTLNDFTNFVEVVATSKFNATQDLDFAFGFDTSVIKPKKAWYWAENVTHSIPAYCNVSLSLVCNSTNFTFTTEPKHAWCYNDSAGNQSLMWERGFVNGWVSNKTIEWFEWRRACTQTSYYSDWKPLTGFSQVSFNNKTWYVLTTSFEPNETKRLRARIDVKPRTSGKYDLAIKRSSDSWEYAFANDLKVLLDPWFNSNFTLRRLITVYEGNATDRLDEPLLLNVTALSGVTNCSYVRIVANYTAETALPFQVMSNEGVSHADGAKYCSLLTRINISSSQNATYAEANTTNLLVYYLNNSDVGSGEVAELNAWANETGFWKLPNDDGWETELGSYGATTTNYTYEDEGHGAWDANDTSSTSTRMLWHYGAGHDAVSIPSSGFTMVGYAKVVSSGTGENGSALLGVENEYSYGASLLIDDDEVRIEDYNLNVFQVKTTTTTDAFHEYRLISQNETAIVYKDGELFFSITNVTANIIGYNQLHLGAWSNSDVYHFILKYLAWKPGMFPPLTYSLGGEESAGSPNLTSNCSELGASLLINYSFADEENFTALAASMDATFWLFNATEGSNRSFSFNWSNVSHAEVCVVGNISQVLLNSWQDYYLAGYDLRNYFLDNYSTPTDITTNITLYLLPSSRAYLAEIEVRDSSSRRVPSALIYIQRYYASNNSYETIAMAKTSSIGETSSYLRANDAWLKFLVKSGGVLYSFAPQKVSCASAPCYVLLEMAGESYDEYYTYSVGAEAACQYNDVSEQITCSVVDSTGLMQYARLVLRKMNLLNYSVECNKTSTSNPATINCDVANVTNGTYSYTFSAHFLSETVLIQDTIDFGITSVFGLEGVVIALFLTLALTGIGLWNPEISIVLGVFALFITFVLGLFEIGAGAIMGLAVIAIILVYKRK